MTEIKETAPKSYINYAEIRDSKGFKNDCQVALKSGVPRCTFTNWNKGRSSPKTDKLAKIAKALKVSISRLVVDEH